MSWAVLVMNWTVLGGPGAAMGLYWAVLGMKWAALGGPGAAMGLYWVVLGMNWTVLGGTGGVERAVLTSAHHCITSGNQRQGSGPQGQCPVSAPSFLFAYHSHHALWPN